MRRPIDLNHDLAKTEFAGKSGQKQSSDVDFDYTGQDLATSYANEASKLAAQRKQAMMEDPLAAMGMADRIRGLQNYVAAYQNGTSLPGMPVIPGRRVKGIRESSETDSSSGGALLTHDPYRQH
jgi:hypothetical protein